MLSVADLRFERYFEPVFQPLGFTLGAGELLVVTGANGSGKTTLLRLLAGLLQPDGGSLRREVPACYLGHLLAIKDDLDVRENLRFMAAFAGAAGTGVDELLARLGLARVARQPARSLSAGQRKRCALGRLLLSDAPLWLLDEPYANLDRAGHVLLDGLLTAHLQAGGACVLATHGEHRPAGLTPREIEVRSALEAAA